MNERIFAKEISVNTEKQVLIIDWADGHHSEYSLDGLRRACPCVECAGGHEMMGKPADASVFKQKPEKTWTITQLQEVGNYAMQIFWGDGHNSGIYRWQYLRDLCPLENS